MSAFEFYFTFYGLILGLAVANVASGFGRLWRDRLRTDVGFCLPLLALVVLLRVVHLWLTTWKGLQAIQVTTITMLVAIGVALPFVFVTTVMFPDDKDEQGSLDAFYLEHSRTLLIALSIPWLVGYLAGYVLGHPPPFEAWRNVVLAHYLPVLVMLVSRNLWVHRLGLTYLTGGLIWILLVYF
jgi:hypothetical protein